MRRSLRRLFICALAIFAFAQAVPASAGPLASWTKCFSKYRPGLSQLGGPIMPGSTFDADLAQTLFSFGYATGLTRNYGYITKTPGTLAWYLNRYPFRGGQNPVFRIPSVKSGNIVLECDSFECEAQFNFNDRSPRSAEYRCPPEVGENVVNMAALPGKPLSDANKCAGFTGYFMTTWGPMRLDNGKGTYVFRTKTDNSIDGTVTPTAKGWSLDGAWRDLTGSGKFRYEMDRATGNFFGVYSKDSNPLPLPVPASGGNWIGQCRATMPTELATTDDKASRDIVTNSPPIAAAQPDAFNAPLPAPGSFTPLDPATVPCGGFTGHLWSAAFGDMFLTNGNGTYRFGQRPEAPIAGTVAPIPTGWVLTGTYGSGADAGTMRLEQDKDGKFVGRYKGNSGSSGALSGSCIGAT